MASRRAGTCSECGAPLQNPAAKTCSKAHRDARSRRLKRAREENADNSLPPQQKAMSQSVRKEVKDSLHDVVKEELRPIVRESITDDVMRGIEKLVRLTPRMVELIEADLESSDDTVRQRAYTLLAKYTLGNASVAPAPAEQAPSPMQVVFQLPRPGDDAPRAIVSTAEEERPCSECGELRSEFVGSSDRCVQCHEEVQARVAHLRGDAPLPE